MTMPTRHPSTDLLFRYASGELREIKSLLVATHLAYCPSCRSHVAAFEAQCGEWFAALAPAEPASPDGASLPTALLERLDDPLPPLPPRPSIEAARLPDEDPVPEPLRTLLGQPLTDRTWTVIAPGVWLSAWSWEAAGTKVCLLRMAAGAAVPSHRHTATEMLLVLKGRFGDEYGGYGVGDVIEYKAHSDHHASATQDGECTCLLLLDGDIIFFE